LHLGHAYSALVAAERAKTRDGHFLLRIEDTDHQRSRPEWEAQIYTDLTWLGLTWETPVRRQSDHLADYADILEQLADRALLYPCACSRADIRGALSAPQEGAPMHGPDGLIYPGTCRHRSIRDRQPGDALRLNMAKAVEVLGAATLHFTETGPTYEGVHSFAPGRLVETVGDVVLARKETEAAAYHLAVVLDDAFQGITEVVRGEDLYEATPLHVFLQHLLGVPVPLYHHHRLIRDAQGKRLAKRSDAEALSALRKVGCSPEGIRARIGL
jgi:glutamyl-Q tRNA(Asp) synthetase